MLVLIRQHQTGSTAIPVLSPTEDEWSGSIHVSRQSVGVGVAGVYTSLLYEFLLSAAGCATQVCMVTAHRTMDALENTLVANSTLQCHLSK